MSLSTWPWMHKVHKHTQKVPGCINRRQWSPLGLMTAAAYRSTSGDLWGHRWGQSHSVHIHASPVKNLTVGCWSPSWNLTWSIQIQQLEVSARQCCCISSVQDLYLLFNPNWLWCWLNWSLLSILSQASRWGGGRSSTSPRVEQGTVPTL